MAINPRSRTSVRTLSALAVITIALYALMAALHLWGGGQLTPKLGLDLAGGTEIVLAPQVTKGKTVSQQQINQAVDIIRQRVDGAGVSEAEVVPQSGRNIVVSIPGRRIPESKHLSSARRCRASARFCARAARWPRRHPRPAGRAPRAAARRPGAPLRVARPAAPRPARPRRPSPPAPRAPRAQAPARPDPACARR